jgi:aldehyde dehydrogenase (NAD+)
MEEIIQSQRTFFNSNATKSIAFRLRQLQKLEDIIRKNEKLLTDAIYQDFKKSPFETHISELAHVYTDLKQAKRKLKKWAKKKRVKTNLPNQPAKSYVIPEPLGVSLIIGAWNYPYLLTLAPMVPAIAAGCTIILKPSELVSNTSSVLTQMLNTAFPSEYIRVIEGGIPETTALLEQKFDKIFFTGSVPVGKIVYQAAAKNLTPVTLELGGKSPAFIAADCNQKIAAKRLIWGKFLNAGQTCIAPDYLLVDEKIADEFKDLLKQELEKSHYSIENENYIQIINDRNFERLRALIDQEKVIAGGQTDASNRWIAPTLMDRINFEDEIMKDEIFGPILPILTYKNLDDAIAKVKARPKPLACYVFTESKAIKHKIISELSYGGGTINDVLVHIANPNFGYGGVGESGIGSYHGENGFRAFSHYKSIIDRPTLFELPLKYYPRTKGKIKLLKRILGW